MLFVQGGFIHLQRVSGMTLKDTWLKCVRSHTQRKESSCSLYTSIIMHILFCTLNVVFLTQYFSFLHFSLFPHQPKKLASSKKCLNFYSEGIQAFVRSAEFCLRLSDTFYNMMSWDKFSAVAPVAAKQERNSCAGLHFASHPCFTDSTLLYQPFQSEVLSGVLLLFSWTRVLLLKLHMNSWLSLGFPAMKSKQFYNGFFN